MSRRAKMVGVHKCSGAGEGHILGLFLWETGILVLVSTVACLLLMYFLGERIEGMLGARLADLFTWSNLYVPLLTVLLLFVVAGALPGRMYARIPVTQVFRRYTEGTFVEARTALCAVHGSGFYLGGVAHYGMAIPGSGEPSCRLSNRTAGSRLCQWSDRGE